MARTSILEAVSAFAAADLDLQDALPGGLWAGEIPEGRAMPYASLEVDSGDTEWTNFGPDLERTRFSVVLYAVGAGTADALQDRLEALLTNAGLEFSGSDYLVYLYPSRRTTRSEFARDKDGQQVFTGALMFEAGVFRYPS